MIDIKLLEQKDGIYLKEYRQSLVNRNYPCESLDELLELNKKRKEFITHAETSKAKQKKISSEIAQKKREGSDVDQLISEMGLASDHVKNLESQANQIDAEVNQLLLSIPNKLHQDVPVGMSSNENKVQKQVGSVPKFNFKPKEHFEIGEKLGLIDFERAGKTTGARFAFLKGVGARLERALIQFMLDTHTESGRYQEIICPYIVNSSSLTGTGQFPKFKDDVFNLSGTDYYLIPTAEVPVTNYYSGEILNESQLPECFTSFSPCFRSEAGSHGRDTKGLIRQHQFHKVELVIFSHPDKSYEAHERLTEDAEKILELLEIPYRRMVLCSGDIGFGAAKCYDLEAWLPGQNTYREISSCSNFESFQARRANIRFRPSGGGKPQFIHTLNGSGLAVGRTLIAILENYQREDGSVAIPKALQKYMGGKQEIISQN